MESCRVCGSQQSSPVLSITAFGFTSSWVECLGCKVERISPYPSSKEIFNYYNNSYLQKVCSDSVSHRVRFAPEYKSTVFDEYRYSLQDVGIDLAALRNKKILDFGCANGVFLEFLASEGCTKSDLVGVDIAQEMVQDAVGRGFKGFQTETFFETVNLKFDAVFLWDVIEHLEYPYDNLLALKKYLAPGGTIFFQTPRIGQLSKALKEKFEHYLPVEHLHLFPRDTLIECVTNCGFQLVNKGSFGANCPEKIIPQPWKKTFDNLAKQYDQGATQVALFKLI